MKKALCLMLSLLMVFSSVVFAGAENETKAADAVTGFTEEDCIVVKCRNLYNKKGEHIQLKGVNLGGRRIIKKKKKRRKSIIISLTNRKRFQYRSIRVI